MQKYVRFALLCLSASINYLGAQHNPSSNDTLRLRNEQLDSLFIHEVENRRESDKVLHAEPLYLGLTCDLGAHKGETELSFGGLMVDKKNHNEYRLNIEYEFAPIERLGLKVELPFSFYQTNPYAVALHPDSLPEHRWDGLNIGAQYTFFVSKKHKTSIAAGYIHDIKLTSFERYGDHPFFEASGCQPYLVAAKRWGHNWHTLLRVGAIGHREFLPHHLVFHAYINTNIHYMIEGTRNFIGIELHKTFAHNGFSFLVQPQMRIGLADGLIVGIAVGIPVDKPDERLSGFLRFTYEPWHRHNHSACPEEF